MIASDTLVIGDTVQTPEGTGGIVKSEGDGLAGSEGIMAEGTGGIVKSDAAPSSAPGTGGIVNMSEPPQGALELVEGMPGMFALLEDKCEPAKPSAL